MHTDVVHAGRQFKKKIIFGLEAVTHLNIDSKNDLIVSYTNTLRKSVFLVKLHLVTHRLSLHGRKYIVFGEQQEIILDTETRVDLFKGWKQSKQ